MLSTTAFWALSCILLQIVKEVQPGWRDNQSDIYQSCDQCDVWHPFISPFLSLSVTSEFCNLSSFESIRMPGRRRGGRADKAQFRNGANPKQIERTIQMQMQTFKHKSKTHTNLRMSKNCQIYEWRGEG